MRQSIYTVGQVNSYIQNMFVHDYLLNRISVKGEVSNCKYHTSGHVYFTLKDQGSIMTCVMFAGQRKGLAFRMEEGQTIIVSGTVSVYERDGKYQLYAKEIVLDGAGRLYQRFEQLKRELEEMGMFAEEYKRPIPIYSKRIGIVTAQTGAAIRDIIHIVTRRNPYVQLVLYPAIVQGDEAAKTIVKGIEALDQVGVDVMIVGRGGGSIEDLWAFNEECVARAIFNCQTPVISAVGHETDTTIADYVADLRAPTPSAAAELAVCEHAFLQNQVANYSFVLQKQMRQVLDEKKGRSERLSMRLRYASPIHQLRQKQQLTLDLEEKLHTRMERKLMQARHRLQIHITALQGLSPLAKLNQGYAYVTDSNGKTLQDIEQIEEREEIGIRLINGRIKAIVTKKEWVLAGDASTYKGGNDRSCR